jgi:hypothetical protein
MWADGRGAWAVLTNGVRVQLGGFGGEVEGVADGVVEDADVGPASAIEITNE